MLNSRPNNVPHNLPVVDDNYQPLGLTRWGSFEITDEEVQGIRDALKADGIAELDASDDEVREMTRSTLRMMMLLNDQHRRRRTKTS